MEATEQAFQSSDQDIKSAMGIIEDVLREAQASGIDREGLEAIARKTVEWLRSYPPMSFDPKRFVTLSK